METYCGSPANMAPEIVRQEVYTEKCDVFSFAIIMWELAIRGDPYPDHKGVAIACVPFGAISTAVGVPGGQVKV